MKPRARRARPVVCTGNVLTGTIGQLDMTNPARHLEVLQLGDNMLSGPLNADWFTMMSV
jgi:hypothetical protein